MFEGLVSGTTHLVRPRIRSITGTDPAANTEISETVTAGKAWHLLSMTVSLVQGATQTPFPVLVIDDGTTALMKILGATAAQAANTTVQYTWAQVGVAITTPSATALSMIAPLPIGLVLPAGYRITTVTGGIGANSNYGAPQLFVVEYELL